MGSIRKTIPLKISARSTAVILAALFITAFLFSLNEIMITIRLKELAASLRRIDREEGSIDHIALVATYEIHKKLFENRISQEKADELENRINSLFIRSRQNHTSIDSIHAWLMAPAAGIINFNRMVLGKQPLSPRDGDNTGGTALDQAFYYERNMHFKKAIGLYEKIMAEQKLPAGITAGVLLHQGYCYALSDIPEKARASYMKILDEYISESSAVTAEILLRYLDGFAVARIKILAGASRPLEQSEKLVNLLAYEQALAVLESLETTAGPDMVDSIRYFKARCHAGLGNTSQAVENYLRVITRSPRSPYAKYSNRKLFMLGTQTGNSEVRELAAELNNRIKDPVLEGMINDTETLKTSPPVIIKPVAVTISQPVRDAVKTLSSRPRRTALKKGSHLVVYTSDGNVFKGKVTDDSPDLVSLETSIGTIHVKKDRIVRITNE